MIQSIVFNNFNSTKKEFSFKYMTMEWTWNTTRLWSQIGSQLSGQQQVEAVQSDQRHKNQQARFWPPYFGMCKVFCSEITLRKEEPSIANIIQHYWCVWRKKSPKKKVLFYQDNTPCHKSIAMIAKLHELHFELLPHAPYSQDLAPNNYWPFADLKECSRERDLAPIKKWYQKVRCILRPKRNRSTKKASNWLVGWVLWHIILCKLFNAKFNFYTNSSISNNSVWHQYTV